MRVLQIIPAISPVYGGPSQMVRGLSQSLAEAGAEVTVLTTTANGDSGQPPLTVPLNQPVAVDNYTVHYFHCIPKGRYKFSPGLLTWLWRYGPTYDIAHIHALFSPVSTAAATVARRQGLPYVLRPLGTLDPADLAKKSRLKRLYGDWLERPNIAGAAALHFTSPLEAERAQRFGANCPEVVIPGGVSRLPPLAPTERRGILAALRIPQDYPIVLYLSRLDPKKGLDLLLPALDQLAAEGLPFHFVLAGGNSQDPVYADNIIRRLEASSLGDRTSCTGFVTGPTKAALLQSATLFVLPSYYENFGIAVAEAMLAGLPVVISQGVDLWPAVAEAEAGWICGLTQPDLANTLRQALKNPTLRHIRGQNARTYAVCHYNWTAIGQRTLTVYHQLLAANSLMPPEELH